MKQKLARFVVRARVPLLIVCVVLAIVCVFSIGKTNINYDLTAYLSDESMTKRALNQMEGEFGESSVYRLMFVDCGEEVFDEQLSALRANPDVAQVAFDKDQNVRVQDGVLYRLVTVTQGDTDGLQFVRDLQAQFDGVCDVVIADSNASTLEIQEKVAQQMPMVLSVAVLIVLVVLLLTSHAWIEPLLIMATLAVSILINMGTNFIFPSISFVTYAVCAILQLALSMDYAIMLVHGFEAQREKGLSPREAVQQAVENALMPISSSALTTIAGLMSLAFMSFSIGIDIGVVLSKGVLISLVMVFLIMPALLLICAKPLEKTRHKAIHLGGASLARGAFKVRYILPAVLVVVIGCAFYLQTGNEYLYTDMSKNNATRIDDVFGENSPLAVLVPLDDSDEGYQKQLELIDDISAIEMEGQPVVNSVRSMPTTAAAALVHYTKDDIVEQFGISKGLVNPLFKRNGWGDSVRADELLTAIAPMMKDNEQIQDVAAQLDMAKQAFNGTSHARIIFDLNLSNGKNANAVIDEILSAGHALYGDDLYLTGTLMSTYDISNEFGADLLKINLITAFAIWLIVLLSFRSFKISVLLVAVIEGAIWITMAISRVMGQPVFFMAYLICVAIQMGATIDYAILLTNHYRTFKQTMLPREALQQAMARALPTILTSGAIFIGAGYAVGKLCTVYAISTIGQMISRGALISVILVLTLLPALLDLLDGKDTRKIKE